MRKLVKQFLALLLLLAPAASFANPVISPAANFGGGLNIKTACTDIAENESCDMSNMVNDQYGASFKRNGAKRYITTAISSNPINSAARVYFSSNNVVYKAVIATTWDRIYYSTDDVNPAWVMVSSGLAHNQHFKFETFGNRVLMTGEGLTDPIKMFNIVNGSMTNLLTTDASSTPVVFQAKHLLASRGYLIAANIRDTTLSAGTTYFPSMVRYSLLNQISSMTAERYFNVQENDGEEITGVGELNKYVHFFKESSIHELSFTALNLLTQGGDQQLDRIVDGFGCIAPRSLVSTGDFYIFLARDGIRMWDGQHRGRTELSQESRILSLNIESIINDLFKSGNYRNCTGYYYAKRQWYIFSYCDSSRLPAGKLNTAIVYDIKTGNWLPFRNWNAEAFTAMNEPGGTGDLVFTDSTDGYVYLADQEGLNDPRWEISLETMNSTVAAAGVGPVIWQRGTTDYINFQEGTGSVRMILSPSVAISSISYMAILNLGNWPDGSRVTKDDKLSFRVYISSLQNLSALRLDLEINDVNSDFDGNFTSVTLSSAMFTGGNNGWTRFEIALSSWPVLASWVSLNSQTFPFANTFTFYGARFVSTGIADASVSVDDFRLVGRGETPLNAYRFTKQFSFGSQIPKTLMEVLLNVESSGDSRYVVDVFNDFGEFAKRIKVVGDVGKEIYTGGYNGNNGVAKLSSNDFTLLDSTFVAAITLGVVRPLTVDSQYIYAADQYNNRIIKIDKSSMTVFVSTFGSLGSGTTNFNTPFQLCLDDSNLYIADYSNHRIKVLRKKDFTFVNTFGTLGLAENTTSFHNPTGIAVDDKNIFIANDANYSIMKVTKSSFGYESSIKLNLNTIGDTTLHVDEKYLFVAYNLLASTSIDHQDVILEKRLKSDFSLINRVKLRPNGISVLAISTYSLLGDLTGTGDFIFVSFIDNAGGNNYIQKRLKRDFSLIREYSSTNRHYAVAANGLDFKPKHQTVRSELGFDGTYIQLKFSDQELDNALKLYNLAFKLKPQEIK